MTKSSGVCKMLRRTILSSARPAEAAPCQKGTRCYRHVVDRTSGGHICQGFGRVSAIVQVLQECTEALDNRVLR